MSSYPHTWSTCRSHRKQCGPHRHGVGRAFFFVHSRGDVLHFLLKCCMSHVILPSHMVHVQESAEAVQTPQEGRPGWVEQRAFNFCWSVVCPMSSYPRTWSTCRSHRKQCGLHRHGVGRAFFFVHSRGDVLHFLLKCCMSHVILPSHMVHVQESSEAVRTPQAWSRESLFLCT